jgi:hypothetical protein
LNPTTWFGDDKPLKYPNTEALDINLVKKDIKKHNQKKEDPEYNEANDPTSPLYEPQHPVQTPPPAFCKPAMCAPYPSMWISGPLEKYMKEEPGFDQCAFEQPAATFEATDNHPNPMYDGAVEEVHDPSADAAPAPAPSVEDKAILGQKSMKELSPLTKSARERAQEKRSRGWKALERVIKNRMKAN